MSSEPSFASRRSLEQRRSALATANRIRLLRAQLKRDWKEAGRQHAAQEAARMVLDPPVYLSTALVIDFLAYLPGITRVVRPRQDPRGEQGRGWKVLAELDIHARRTLGGLSKRQRTDLSDWLTGYAEGARPR